MTEVATENKVTSQKRSSNPRIFTAALIGIAVFASIYFGNFGISALFVIIAIFGGFELSKILDPSGSKASTYTHVIIAALPILVLRVVDVPVSIFEMLLWISIVVMTGLIINLWTRPIPYSKLSYLFTLAYWGLPFGLATYYLATTGQDSAQKFLGVILLLWTSDSMAYFTGRSLGKHKLFPSVSPGKTIEGSIGGGVFSLLVGLAFAYFTDQNYMAWIIIALVVWILGTLGDLVESKLKRVQKVKDSGSILPGHGGFLDRFDSLIMVIPFLLALAYFFGS